MEKYELGDVIYVHDDIENENDYNPWAVIVYDTDLKSIVAIQRNGGITYEREFHFRHSEFRHEGNLNLTPNLLDSEYWFKNHIDSNVNEGVYLLTQSSVSF